MIRDNYRNATYLCICLVPFPKSLRGFQGKFLSLVNEKKLGYTIIYRSKMFTGDKTVSYADFRFNSAF